MWNYQRVHPHQIQLSHHFPIVFPWFKFNRHFPIVRHSDISCLHFFIAPKAMAATAVVKGVTFRVPFRVSQVGFHHQKLWISFWFQEIQDACSGHFDWDNNISGILWNDMVWRIQVSRWTLVGIHQSKATHKSSRNIWSQEFHCLHHFKTIRLTDWTLLVVTLFFRHYFSKSKYVDKWMLIRTRHKQPCHRLVPISENSRGEYINIHMCTTYIYIYIHMCICRYM